MPINDGETYVTLLALNRAPTPKENIYFDFDVFIMCLLGSTPSALDSKAVALRELLTTLLGVRALVINFLGGVAMEPSKVCL